MITAVGVVVYVLVILQASFLGNAHLQARLVTEYGRESHSSGILQLQETNTSSSSSSSIPGLWHTPCFPPVFSWHSLPRVLNIVCRELGFADGAVFGTIDTGKPYKEWEALRGRRVEDILCGGEETSIDECLVKGWNPSEDFVGGHQPLWITCDDGVNSVGVNCHNWNCAEYFDGWYHNERDTCYCDPNCELFGDCCFDHDDPVITERRREVFGNSSTTVLHDLRHWACVDLPISSSDEKGFWLVTKCPQSYEDQTVRQLCEESLNSHNDPPVYDPEGIHYRNVYCALCHGSENTTLWEVCPSESRRDEYCWTADEYDSMGNIITNNKTQFFYILPGSSNSGHQPLGELVTPRWCTSNMIHDCRPDLSGAYRNIGVACRTLIGDIVYKWGAVFANSNCAICNGAVDVGTSCVLQSGIPDAFNHVPWYEDREFVFYCEDGLKLVNGQCVSEERGYWPGCESVFSRLVIEDHEQDQVWDCSREDANVFRYLQGSVKSKGLFAVLHEDRITLEVNMGKFRDLSRGIDSYIARTPRDTSLLCAPTHIRLLHECNVRSQPLSKTYGQDGKWFYGDLSDFEPVFIAGENMLLYQQKLFLNTTLYQNSTIYTLPEDRVGYIKKYHVSVFGVKLNISNCVMTILTPSQYEIGTVETTFVIVSRGIYFHPSEYFIFANDSVLVCLRTPEDVKLFTDKPVSLQTTLARVGFGISSVSLTLTLITYCLFRELRNLHGLVIMNMVLALLLSHILLAFVADFVTHLAVACTVIAASAHYFWLATFFWKTVVAFDLCKTLSSNSATALLANTGKVRKLIVYSAFGWGIPLVILAISLGLHFHPWQQVSLLQYGVLGNGVMCWIVQPVANVLAFGIPCALCLCVNGVLFVATTRSMLKIRRQPGNVGGSGKFLHKNGWKVDLLIHAKISVLLGFSWISGFVASFLQLEAMWYVFIVINSLQGVVIFIFFGLNKRARYLFCRGNK